MLYRMILTGIRGKTFSFRGVKYVKNDSFGEVGLEDTTTLFVTVYQGKNFSGKPVGNGKLFVTLPNFMKQLAATEITNTQSKVEKLKWESRFYDFFIGSLLDIYSPVTTKKGHFDLDAPPRIKRPLRLNGKNPEVHRCVTKDKVWAIHLVITHISQDYVRVHLVKRLEFKLIQIAYIPWKIKRTLT